MNNAIFTFSPPANEPILQYTKGSNERVAIKTELARMGSDFTEIPLIIEGKEIRTGTTKDVTMPHNHKKVIGISHQATIKEIKLAVEASLKAKLMWENISWTERSSIMLRAAELISKKYRNLLLASTMLCQDKNVYQAEIDLSLIHI